MNGKLNKPNKKLSENHLQYNETCGEQSIRGGRQSITIESLSKIQ